MPELRPFIAGPNELWNNIFPATQYAYLMEGNRIGSPSFDIANWHGRVIAKLFKAISVIYGDDRTKYETVCESWCADAPANSNNRLNSTRYLTEPGVVAGDAAKFWATAVAVAPYIVPTYYATATETTMATEWASATQARKTELENEYMLNEGASVDVRVWANRKTQILAWVQWADSFGLKSIWYEGGLQTNIANATGNVGNFRDAAKKAPITYWLTHKHFQYFASIGGQWPAHYNFGGRSTWSLFDADIYDTPSPQWNAIVDWSLGKRAFLLQCA